MPLKVNFSHSKRGHWVRNKVKHGPQVWPWWRVVSLSVVRIDVHTPSFGYRLWVYTRWGAWCGDVYVDRRASFG